MNKSRLRKICLPLISSIAVMSMLLYLPLISYGQEDPCPMDVAVSPYQVNIDSGGLLHYIRVLTYTSYRNTEAAFVYINDNLEAVESEYIKLTRDSFGRLVVKIYLEALQNAELEPDTIHDLKIVVVLKEAVGDCEEKEGIGGIRKLAND